MNSDDLFRLGKRLSEAYLLAPKQEARFKVTRDLAHWNVEKDGEIPTIIVQFDVLRCPDAEKLARECCDRLNNGAREPKRTHLGSCDAPNCSHQGEAKWRAFPARQLTGKPYAYHAYVGHEKPEDLCCSADHRSAANAERCAEVEAKLRNRRTEVLSCDGCGGEFCWHHSEQEHHNCKALSPYA